MVRELGTGNGPGRINSDNALDNTRGGGDNGRPPRSFSPTEVFNQSCPIYMAMGMSYSDFWDGEPEMARAYSKAYELKIELENDAMWQMGAYIAEAVASSIYGKKAPYPTKPHSLGTRLSKEREKAEEYERMQREQQAIMAKVQQWVTNCQRKASANVDGQNPLEKRGDR